MYPPCNVDTDAVLFAACQKSACGSFLIYYTHFTGNKRKNKEKTVFLWDCYRIMLKFHCELDKINT